MGKFHTCEYGDFLVNVRHGSMVILKKSCEYGDFLVNVRHGSMVILKKMHRKRKLGGKCSVVSGF